MSRQVVTVGLLTSYIRELVESDPFLSDLWVEGEIAEAFAARSGHVYFTLRDDDSRIKCVIFRAQAQSIRALPRTGEQVAVHGSLSVYERDGNYQLYVDFIQTAGQGILALQLELLRQQLRLEGLFDQERKRPIPEMPSVIGVVTSEDGAVWHDIQQVIRRRYPLVHLVLAPTPVQGDAAPTGIVNALRALQFDGRPEVIIVARGGGSAEDLWCFNDERVARAVFACRVPVVSGVGHETDSTLIDDVADLRAPTPSAAAELCTPSIVDLAERIVDAQHLIDRSRSDAISDARIRVERVNAALRLHALAQTLQRHRAAIDAHQGRMKHCIDHQVIDARQRVFGTGERLNLHVNRRQIDHVRRLELERARLQALDPLRVLQRGYGFVTAAEGGRTIRRANDLQRGFRIAIHMADGVIEGQVEQVRPGRQRPITVTERADGLL